MKFSKQAVYELLRQVRKGKVITYGRIAELMGNPMWARSVGNALHKNPDGGKYPCYKVVTAQGKLSRAYAFGGLLAQKRRLEADGIVVCGDRVDLKKYGS